MKDFDIWLYKDEKNIIRSNTDKCVFNKNYKYIPTPEMVVEKLKDIIYE